MELLVCVHNGVCSLEYHVLTESSQISLFVRDTLAEDVIHASSQSESLQLLLESLQLLLVISDIISSRPSSDWREDMISFEDGASSEPEQ